MLSQVLALHLAGDIDIVADLASYDFGDGDEAAIFSTEPGIPDDASYPAIYIQQIGTAGRYECRESRGSRATVDVSVYGDNIPASDIESLAEKIWRRLDRANLASLMNPRGFDPWFCLAAFPARSGDGSFPGYVISVEVAFLEL